MADDERYRLDATLWLRRAEDDGPRQPRASGYRPNCWFGHVQRGERLYNDCVVEFEPGGDVYAAQGTLWVPPGGECRARLTPLWPQFVRNFARPGSTFEVCEGHWVMADGLVEAVHDPGPAHDPEWHAPGPNVTSKEEAIEWAREEAARVVAGDYDIEPMGRFNAAQRIESVLCRFQWGDAANAPPGIPDFVFGWNVSGPETDAAILLAAQELVGTKT